jgi:hypothetical protein
MGKLKKKHLKVNHTQTLTHLNTFSLIKSYSEQLLYFEPKEISTINYVENTIWTLVSIRNSSAVPRDRFQYFQDAELYGIKVTTYNVTVQRRPLYFMMNSIFPSLVLNLITVLSFALPFASQIALGMTTFLTYSIYSINTSNSIPTQSDYVPAITVFYIMSTFFVLISFSWFILENFMRSRTYMPLLLRVWVKLFRKLEQAFSALVQKVSKSCKKQQPNEQKETEPEIEKSQDLSHKVVQVNLVDTKHEH